MLSPKSLKELGYRKTQEPGIWYNPAVPRFGTNAADRLLVWADKAGTIRAEMVNKPGEYERQIERIKSTL